MLYDQYCVALVPERPESAEQAVRIGGVQSGRGFVQDDAGRIFVEKPCQQEFLRLPAGQIHTVLVLIPE